MWVGGWLGWIGYVRVSCGYDWCFGGRFVMLLWWGIIGVCSIDVDWYYYCVNLFVV